MEKLVEVLQTIIEKYGISEEDFNKLQEALTELETGANEEFAYEEDEDGREAADKQ